MSRNATLHKRGAAEKKRRRELIARGEAPKLYSEPGRPHGICVLCDEPAPEEFSVAIAEVAGDPAHTVFEFCSDAHRDHWLWFDAQSAHPAVAGNPFAKGDPPPNPETAMHWRFRIGEITAAHLQQWTRAQKAVTA